MTEDQAKLLEAWAKLGTVPILGLLLLLMSGAVLWIADRRLQSTVERTFDIVEQQFQWEQDSDKHIIEIWEKDAENRKVHDAQIRELLRQMIEINERLSRRLETKGE